MSEEEVSMVKNCTTCSASIRVSPEDLVITCPYCGDTFDAGGNKIPDHQMLPTVPGDQIKENFMGFLKKNKVAVENVSLDEVHLQYIPYWLVPFQSTTDYYGVKNGTVTRQRQVQYKDREGNTRTRTENYTVNVYKPVEDSFPRTGRENIIARKHTAFYGFENYQRGLHLDAIEPFDFAKIKEYEADFINAEVDVEEAKRDAHGSVENENRSIARSKVDKLVRCDSNINLGIPMYAHAPLWQARYKFQGKNYKMSANGVNGKVAKGEVPLTLGRRLVNYIIGIAIMMVGAIVGSFIGMSEDDSMKIVGLIVGLAVMAISFVVTRTAFKMQLEKGEKMKKLKQKKEDK
ncbi:MAG: hypothetical protein ACFFCS_11040 [Candidatus Hodarchaeota archaeon]